MRCLSMILSAADHITTFQGTLTTLNCVEITTLRSATGSTENVDYAFSHSSCMGQKLESTAFF